MDKSSIIFGNPIDQRTIRKADRSKAKYIKKFGNDLDKIYHLRLEPIESIQEIRMCDLVMSDEELTVPDKALVVGNIRMGFGHYRISIAMASCAQALGFVPLWLDLASFDITGSKMIRSQNDLYSLASRISQRSRLFNKAIWEPLNSEGFRKLTYNAVDQRNSELLVPIFHDLPKDIPYVATHVWPAQGAVHAGLTKVVNAIPDNWPMALHLAEGAIHTVQTPFAYMGYKMLNGMAKKPLAHMTDDSLFMTGHYVDHELVSNIEEDCGERIGRARDKAPVSFLLTVGGAGAGGELYLALAEHLSGYVRKGMASLIINFGDHIDMWEYFKKKLPGFENKCRTFFDEYGTMRQWAASLGKGTDCGIYCICNKNIFEAVYSTNLLMRKCDVLVTKPSELSFYPVPKLMMRHIGGHEVYGAVHASEIGDATFECESIASLKNMADSLIEDRQLLIQMNENIKRLKTQGVYDGGYNVVRLAAEGIS